MQQFHTTNEVLCLMDFRRRKNISEDLVLAEERTSKKDRQRIMEGKYTKF